MSDDDNWVQAAMDDTDLVAHVLLTLRQPSSSSNLKPPALGWSIRQRRSKPLPTAAKKSPAARASPTTPLSWSGATSVSADGIEESSRLVANRSDISRSKAIRPNEITPTKRPRKKKTLAELKEDETTLLKERKQLKRQLAALQATCQKQRKENESLKKMKIELPSHALKLEEAATVTNSEPHQTMAAVHEAMEAKEGEFVLPDLNIPAGDE